MAKNFEKACVIGGGVIGSSFTLLFRWARWMLKVTTEVRKVKKRLRRL